MEPRELHEYKTDHDILVSLSVEMRLLRVDIKEMKDNTKVTIDDHEERIRKIEAAVADVLAQKQYSERITRIGGAIFVIAIGVIEFFINHFWK